MAQPAVHPHQTPAPTPDRITGLVLAGGRGSRMGGIDKGLVPWHGQPLARHALDRLAPQAGSLAISANRNADVYDHWGVPVWPDTLAGFPGPLAGLLTGLTRAATGWVITVPCDSPRFPHDLVARLAQATIDQDAPLAMAASRDIEGRLHPEPAFCLAHASLRPGLEQFLHTGGRRVRQWGLAQGAVLVAFDLPGDDPQAFANANTADELATLTPAPR